MSTTITPRQQAWLDAAERSDGLAAGLFTLLAQPNEAERGHSCIEHSQGFRRAGRRGFKCGICGTVVKWVDPAPDPVVAFDADGNPVRASGTKVGPGE